MWSAPQTRNFKDIWGCSPLPLKHRNIYFPHPQWAKISPNYVIIEPMYKAQHTISKADGKISRITKLFGPILRIYVLNIIKNPVTYVYNIGIFTVKKILESFFQILIHHRDAPSWWARHKIGHLNQYQSQIGEIPDFSIGNLLRFPLLLNRIFNV